jgi:hypothetical protein
MNGLRQALDQGDTFLFSHPKNARSVDRPDTATREDGLRGRVHDGDGLVLMPDMPAAVSGDGIAPTQSVTRRRPMEAAVAAGRGSITGRLLAALRGWVDAGQLAPYRDTTAIGRHTGARC